MDIYVKDYKGPKGTAIIKRRPGGDSFVKEYLVYFNEKYQVSFNDFNSAKDYALEKVGKSMKERYDAFKKKK